MLTMELFRRELLQGSSTFKADPSSRHSPYHFELNGTQKNFNSTQIHQWSTSVSSERALKSITFPENNVAHRLHLFGLSFSPSIVANGTSTGPALSVRRAKFTSRWETINGNRAQAVEVTLANLLPAHTLAPNTSITNTHNITITGAGIKTVGSGSVYRLVPGDQARVDVFVTGSRANGTANVQIADSDGRSIGSSAGWPTSPLIEKWTADAKVLSAHETPTWVRYRLPITFSNSKAVPPPPHSGTKRNSASCKPTMFYHFPQLF